MSDFEPTYLTLDDLARYLGADLGRLRLLFVTGPLAEVARVKHVYSVRIAKAWLEREQ